MCRHQLNKPESHRFLPRLNLLGMNWPAILLPQSQNRSKVQTPWVCLSNVLFYEMLLFHLEMSVAFRCHFDILWRSQFDDLVLGEGAEEKARAEEQETCWQTHPHHWMSSNMKRETNQLTAWLSTTANSFTPTESNRKGFHRKQDNDAKNTLLKFVVTFCPPLELQLLHWGAGGRHRRGGELHHLCRSACPGWPQREMCLPFVFMWL